MSIDFSVTNPNKKILENLAFQFSRKQVQKESENISSSVSHDYLAFMQKIFSEYKSRADLIPAFVKNLFLREPREMQFDNLGNPVESPGFLFEYLFYARTSENKIMSEEEAKSFFKEICAVAISSYPVSFDCMKEDLSSERLTVNSPEELNLLIDEADSFKFSAIEYALRPLVRDFVEKADLNDVALQKLFLTAEKIFVRPCKKAQNRNLGVFYSWEDFLEMVDETLLVEEI